MQYYKDKLPIGTPIIIRGKLRIVKGFVSEFRDNGNIVIQEVEAFYSSYIDKDYVDSQNADSAIHYSIISYRDFENGSFRVSLDGDTYILEIM